MTIFRSVSLSLRTSQSTVMSPISGCLIVNAADPGYTATDFNGHRGTQTVTEGTDAIVTLAAEPAAAGTGRYIDRFGPVPW